MNIVYQLCLHKNHEQANEKPYNSHKYTNCKYTTPFPGLTETKTWSKTETVTAILHVHEPVGLLKTESDSQIYNLVHHLLNLYSIYTCAKENNTANQKWILLIPQSSSFFGKPDRTPSVQEQAS